MKIALYSPSYWRIPDEYFEPSQHQMVRIDGDLTQLVTKSINVSPSLLVLHGLPQDERMLIEVARLCRMLPETAIVPHLEEPDREFLIKLMRAGVSEVLLNETPESVREILVRVAQKIKKVQRDDAARGKVIGLISAKGGDGSSFLAGNLATSIAMSPDTQVLAIDLALPFGDLDLYMTSSPLTNTLVNFSDEADRLDGALLRSMVHHVSSQLDLVASPKVFDEAFRVDPLHVRKLIEIALHEYDYIIVDFGSQVGPFVTQVLEELDDLIMAVTATMPSVRHASQLMRLWEGLEFDLAKVSLVLNRYSEHFNIKPDDLSRAVGRSISALIPGETQLAEEALLRSEPILNYDPKSKLSKAIREWSSRWTGVHEREEKSLWHRLKIR